MTAQVIRRGGKPEWAVLPYDEYLRLLEAAEMQADVESYDAAVADSDEETVPHEVVRQLASGESPLRVWREYRGLSQAALAKAAGITPAYLSQMEGGMRQGTTRTLCKLAKALNVDLDDLTEDE